MLHRGASMQSSPIPTALHRHLVLVVEDNVDAQVITASNLRHFGYDVMKASSLEEAKTLSARRKPNVVVLDCRLPDGDGLELAAQWRKDPRMKDVAIIVLTAFSARQDMEAALLAGVDAFLVKPTPGPTLAAHVERVLEARPSQRMRTK
jgi:two-component system phosphate regulon response regulator PhoB